MTWNICLTYPHSASRKNSTNKEKVSGGLSFLKQVNRAGKTRQAHIQKFRSLIACVIQKIWSETRSRPAVTHFSRK